MTSHELAQKLLKMPNLPVGINDACGDHYEIQAVTLEDGPRASIELIESDKHEITPHIHIW